MCVYTEERSQTTFQCHKRHFNVRNAEPCSDAMPGCKEGNSIHSLNCILNFRAGESTMTNRLHKIL